MIAFKRVFDRLSGVVSAVLANERPNRVMSLLVAIAGLSLAVWQWGPWRAVPGPTPKPKPIAASAPVPGPPLIIQSTTGPNSPAVVGNLQWSGLPPVASAPATHPRAGP